MNACISMNAGFFAMQSQQISWLPMLGTRLLPQVVPGPLFEICFCKVGIVRALLFDNIVPFGKTEVLETLTHKVEQCWTVFCERKEVLGLKLCLIGCNVSGNIQAAMLCAEHVAFQKTLMSTV